MMRKIVLLSILIIGSQMIQQPVLAFDQYLGFSVGRGVYADDLGDSYTDETTAFGLNYDIKLLPVLGLSFHVDYLTKMEGSLEILDHQGNTLGEISTDLYSYIVSAGPTVYLKFLPAQPIIPHIGAGLSYYTGVQTFERNELNMEDKNDFTGAGYYVAVGIDVKFLPWIGFTAQGKGHVITLDIEERSRTVEKNNTLLIWYLGVNFSI